jgi:hypothetical protein
MSQTSNPKKGDIWNKPKTSTYVRFGAALYLNEDNGHVEWSGLSEYSDSKEAVAFLEKFGTAVPEAGLPLLKKWVAAKVAYDTNRNPGDPLNVGLVEAHKAFKAG